MFRSIAAILTCYAATCQGFVPRAAMIAARSSAIVLANDMQRAEPDSMVNKLSVFVMNSPLNAFKMAISKMGVGDYDTATVTGDIESNIKKHKVMCFSWTNCPFCKKANALLQDLLEPTEFCTLQLDQMPLGKAYRYELAQKTGRTSVPQIWIAGEYIGGCNDGPGLLTLHSQGKLVPMLQKAGCKLRA